MDHGLQATALCSFGASPAEVEELLAYNQNHFALDALPPGCRLPFPDEPFVAAWRDYAAEAEEQGAFPVLARRLPQLRFPIAAGMGESAEYRAATRQGVPPEELAAATGLTLVRPAGLSLVIHPSPAGRIPILIARERSDFVTLVRAFTGRNEPIPVPDSQGALMVAGYNNWDRLGALRRAWEARGPGERETATWGEELARLKPQRDLYQDRFILLSDGPYSAVPAKAMDMPDEVWRATSLAIRREHECAHYFTRRLFGSMRNNLLDELIADYAGIAAAAGGFRADWFLRFLGVAAGVRQPGGRLELYRGNPPLSDGAFAVLARLVEAAAENLERFDAAGKPGGGLAERALRLAALASLRMEDLAAAGGAERLAAVHGELRGRLAWQLAG